MTTALYRRYRPETFTEVIGQEHVTEPLLQALRTNRVSHAYLFSGPRGCGKTTSARILARCLNCAQGPAPEPCGTCDSCVDLARGGAGSLDVVEIDAASHNGVDDARDLRERAAYAPARDRFKIFILDEAHMVTPQGFNALLKIVEEPPPHVKFVFATTEPDKVIGTIRSRTHHYPFRLVAPDTLQPYLEQICASEGVTAGPGVLPLVVRAGGGSVRDSLSVLDQLVAGAGSEGIDYENAVALLGYTHAALLDDTVDGIAARDGAAAFRVVARVIATGHEPRRFVEDLLERLRDLIVIAASGDGAEGVLNALPADQVQRMRAQASVLGAFELSRSADLANAALTEMTGATSPRLHLELLIARLLLPAADDGALGFGARLDRVERAVAGGAVGGGPVGVGPVASAPVATAPTPELVPDLAPSPVPGRASARTQDRVPQRTPDRVPQRTPDRAPDSVADVVPDPVSGPAPGLASASPSAGPPAASSSTPSASPTGGDLEMVRRRWPEVLQTLQSLRKITWVLVSQNAQVAEVANGVVTLAFSTPQLATTFRSGPHPGNVQRALHETIGLDVRVETSIGEGASGSNQGGQPTRGRGAGGGASSGGASGGSASGGSAAFGGAPGGSAGPGGGPAGGRVGDGGEAQAGNWTSTAVERATASWDAPLVQEPPDDPEPAPVVDGGRKAGRSGPRARVTARRAEPVAPDPEPEMDAHPDDVDMDASGLIGAPLVAQMLGGTVIDEVTEDD